MAEKRRALGRGLGALIPSAPSGGAGRPVDVFFAEQKQPQAPLADERAASQESAALAGSGDTGTLADSAAAPAALDAPEEGSETEDGAARASAAPGGATPADDGVAQGNLAVVPGAEFAELDIESIRPNPRQPRTVFDEDHMGELVHSIREIGVLQPIVVRRIPADQLDEA